MLEIHIDYAADDSCQIRLWAKGTHSAEVFLPACEQALWDWDNRKVSLTGSKVEYVTWRTVRADAETRARGVCDFIRKESAPGRGAYAATVLADWLPLQKGTSCIN